MFFVPFCHIRLITLALKVIWFDLWSLLVDKCVQRSPVHKYRPV